MRAAELLMVLSSSGESDFFSTGSYGWSCLKELSRKTISINERAKKIEWVVAGSLKSYFYASLVFTQGKDLVVGFIKPSPVVRDGKSRTEKFGIGSEDAVVLVLGDINANVDYRGEFP